MQDEKNVTIAEPVKEDKPAEPKKQAPKKKEIMVMTRTSYLHEYPSVTSDRVLMYPMISAGEEVEVISRTKNEDEWCKVKLRGATGYCKEAYLTPRKA